ncbi:nucleotidyltransferase [Bacillus sp. 28A-2]|nr:nucleotidyltransferase [Bacillus sp. 28A-2]
MIIAFIMLFVNIFSLQSFVMATGCLTSVPGMPTLKKMSFIFPLCYCSIDHFTIARKAGHLLKATGVVVEYNPFHYGHAHHVRQAKKQTSSDVAIAVMSGSFLQRGEPAIVSKWARTKMALQNGVDIVCELPYIYAVQKAETFANGAVSILDALKCRSLFFGSEDGDINVFKRTAHAWQEKKAEIDLLTKEKVKEGLSYPAAAAAAFQETIYLEHLLDLSKPNNILGFHYVKAILERSPHMQPFTSKRIASGYHDEKLPVNQKIASATSIRKALKEHGSFEAVTPYLPDNTLKQLHDYHSSYGLLHTKEAYFSFLKHVFHTMNAAELEGIYEMEEGIEHRMQKAITHASSYEEYLSLVKTKRYTWTRLQRMNTHLLMRVKKKDMHQLLEEKKAPYIRLLGMSKKGQQYLSLVKKELDVPLVSKLSSFSHPALDLDIRASRVFSLPIREPMQTELTEAEFKTSPIRYDEETGLFQSR